MSQPTPPAEPGTQSRKGIVRRWWAGLWRQQWSMAYGPRHKQVLAETQATLRRVRDLKVAPTRIESFEAAVARQGLTAEVLCVQLRRFKTVHLSLYFLAGALAVYATYLALNFSILFGLGAFIASVGVAVNGYLHGFRAWQIEHRRLIRLQDALRMPSTYLVL